MPQHPPVDGPAAASRLPAFGWLILGLVLALTFAQFWWQTIPVRFANTDDLAFQREADQHRGGSYMTEAAQTQARFFYAAPVFHRALLGLYEIRSPALFSLWRAIGFFVQVGLLAWLSARVLGSPAFGAAVALVISCTLHLPPTIYLVLSYPFNWIGCSALLAGLLCHHAYLQCPRLGCGIMAGACYLLACLMHELFVLALPVFLALSMLGPHGGWRRLVRANLGPLVVAASYVAVYLVFSREFPTAYDGTHFSANFVAAGKIVIRQMVGIAPGFELLVNRPPPETAGPLFRTLPAIAQTFGQLPGLNLLLGIAQGLALTWVLSRCLLLESPVVRYWPWMLALAVGVNLPIAFSEKYQTFIFHREYPYAYAFYSFLCAGVGGVGFVAWIGQRSLSPLNRRVLIGALGVIAVTLCVSAQASNHRILRLLVERFN